MNFLEVSELDDYLAEVANEEKPTSEWEENGFDLVSSLNNTKGIFLEIAGPTTRGYSIIDDESKLNKPIYTSNIKPGLPLYDPDEGDLVGIKGRVDLVADATTLPVENESVGALFLSGLPQDITDRTIEEIARTVENHGYVVWQSGVSGNISSLIAKGFVLKKSQTFGKGKNACYTFVCQKNRFSY